MRLKVSFINIVVDNIVKELWYSHDNILNDYGVPYSSLSSKYQRYFAFEVLKRCFLNFGEEGNGTIEIAPLVEIAYCRRVIGNKYKFPFTLALLGFNNEITGVKAVVYDYHTMKESGVFLIINQEETLSKVKLIERMKKEGFVRITKELSVAKNKRGVPILFHENKDGATNIVYLEHIKA